MEDRQAVLNEINAIFDLQRLENLSIPGKFELVNFCGLIYQEAVFAGRTGILKLDQSPRYSSNKTYQLFAMLVSNGTKFEHLKQIICNYARCHRDSDVFYAKTVLIGAGLLLIDKGFEPTSIYNYLMHLLGKDFLLENLKYTGIPTITEEDTFDVSNEIDYKPFEGNMRETKYDMLGIINYSHAHTFDETSLLINNKYNNEIFRFYFNILNVPSANVRKVIFDEFNVTGSRSERLMLSGAKAIHDGLDVFSAHYIFNSIIGKYSRYDKDSVEIQNEANQRLSFIESSN